MNLETNITQWLNSGEYQTEIDSVLTNIIRGAELAQSEAETASIFEREIYYFIRQSLGISIDIRKEAVVGGISHSFGRQVSGKGRLDAVVNHLVIEYKHHRALSSAAACAAAYRQVEAYLYALEASSHVRYDAILTDGIQIAYFSFNRDEVHHTPLKTLSKDDIDTIIRAIIHQDTKKLVPANMVRDFAVSPHSSSISKEIAQLLYRLLVTNISEKTGMLFAEWKVLMHLSVDDNGKSRDIEKRRADLSCILGKEIQDAESEYKGLFALQTTYAIIVKLVACKVVDKLNLNAETTEYHDLLSLPSARLRHFFQLMEDGYSYSSMRIRNFLEGDFFSWYADESQWNEAFCQKIKKVLVLINQYSAFSLDVVYEPIDIFKDLYMSIIPQSVRHSMGEYFTPEWLADRVVSEAQQLVGKAEWNAIDPCCGSGIFIINLIRKVVGPQSILNMSHEDRKALQRKILSRVYGIDINPLSVLSARVSYYLALYQLGQVEDVEIPIYLGDSAIVPQSVEIDGIPCYSYSIDNLKCDDFEVVLPRRMVQDAGFGAMMNRLQAMVRTDNVEVLYTVMKGALSEVEAASENLQRRLILLAEKLVYLHVNNWDGIWIRIATNFMMIARLPSFDLIVGNPPWVKWEHLPAAYTRKIRNFCDVRHIFCNDGGMYGGAQLNICALISHVAACNWLKREGILAFLMPDSLMSQNSYEEFRHFYMDEEKKERLYMQKLDRWLAPLRPFKVGNKSVMQDFNTYYYGFREQDYAKGVDVTEISRQKQVPEAAMKSCATFDAIRPYLTMTRSVARQFSPVSTAFTYVSEDFDFSAIIGETAYLYRTGVESTPFEVFKLLGEGASSKKNHYRFKNKTLKTSRYKVKGIPPQGWDFPVELIYPMLEGPRVSAFAYDCENNFHIIPYTPEQTSMPIAMTELVQTQPELAEYFACQKELLDKQSEKSKAMHQGCEFYALSKIGPYTFAPVMVAARDNSKFCAAVVRPTRTPWGEWKQTICVKHTIIISQDKDRQFISEDEAHYINGVLNSTIVVNYIHRTFKTNGFSLNKSQLFLPKFQPGEILFTSIAELSREATLCPEKRESLAQELTEAYLKLCRRLNRPGSER